MKGESVTEDDPDNRWCPTGGEFAPLAEVGIYSRDPISRLLFFACPQPLQCEEATSFVRARHKSELKLVEKRCSYRRCSALNSLLIKDVYVPLSILERQPSRLTQR